MKRILFVIAVLLLIVGSSAVPSPAHAGGPCDSDANGQGCLDAMKANPAPDLEPIAVDKREVGAYSFYRVQPETELFDTPNGNVIGKMANGFNFVIVIASKDGFAQLRDKTWVKRTQLKQTYASVFSGVAMKDLPYPMAWIIQATIPSPAPGASNNIKTPAINRYTRIYIYATVKVGQWDWYLVGPGQWVEQRKVARILPVQKPAEAGNKWVNVNLFEQVLTAYEGDRMVFATLISSGLPNFQTNVGTFKVWDRHASTPMSGAMGQPDFYSLPAVPYVMFFDNDISLHGTYWHDGFGFKHSHGCVNMTITDAKWIFNWQGTDDLTVNVVSGT